jgi:hypothetical protein
MKKTPPREKRLGVLRLDPYDVVHYLRQQGHAFSIIARDIPMWLDDDSAKTRLAGSQLKEWYEEETERRRGRSGSMNRAARCG